jgi:membrane protein required for colicin V production
MLTIDYILLAVLIVSISVGIFRGFFKEALSLVTWVVALWASFRFAHLLEPLLAAVSSEALKMWAARIIAFILILIAGGLINALVGTCSSSTRNSGGRSPWSSVTASPSRSDSRKFSMPASSVSTTSPSPG